MDADSEDEDCNEMDDFPALIDTMVPHKVNPVNFEHCNKFELLKDKGCEVGNLCVHIRNGLMRVTMYM